jgi:hypothetical protein
MEDGMFYIHQKGKKLQSDCANLTEELNKVYREAGEGERVGEGGGEEGKILNVCKDETEARARDEISNTIRGTNLRDDECERKGKRCNEASLI